MYNIFVLKGDRTMKNLRNALAILMLIPVFALSGCSDLIKVINIFTGPSVRELREEAVKMSTDAFDAIKNRDDSALSKLFCPNTLDKDQIKGLLNCIEGDIEECSEPVEYNLPIHFVYDSRDYTIVRCDIEDVRTKDGKNYLMRFISCSNSVFDKGDKGVQSVAVYEGDHLVCSAGKVLERYDKKAIPDKPIDVDINQFSAQQAQTEYCENILCYLATGDKEAFVSMFNGNIKSRAENSFDDIMSLTGGDIKAYSRMDTPGNGGSWAKDHWERMSGPVTVYDITNSKDEIFEIEMDIVFVNLDQPSNEGITSFEIRKVDPVISDTLDHAPLDKVNIS